MWQHVNGHAIGGHHRLKIYGVKNSKLKDAQKDRVIDATSTHHQMMRPGNGAVVLAIGVDEKGEPLANERIAYMKEVAGKSNTNPDIEVLSYPNQRVLCFQPHPEFATASRELKDYFLECIDEHLVPFA